MTGTTNQAQVSFGTGVQTVLNTTPGTASGISIVPANPGVSVTGTLYGVLFTCWTVSSVTETGYSTSIVVANWDSCRLNDSSVPIWSITTLDCGNIQQINNSLNATWSGLTSLVATSLTQINVDFSLIVPTLTTLSLPLLKYIGRTFTCNFSALSAFSLPSLESTGSSFTPAGTYTSMSFPLLSYVGQIFGPNVTCTSIDVSSLAIVITTVAATFTTLTTLSLPALVSVGSTFTITAPSLTTFSIGGTLKSIGGNFTMTGMALNQASVDGILVSLAALDGTNGTTSYNNFTVNLSGGTSATPSATGLAAKTTLQGRGCTVTTN